MIPWTVASQDPLFMEFPMQEYWSGLPFPFPGDLPNPGIELGSPTLQAESLASEPPGKLQPRLLTPAAGAGVQIFYIPHQSSDES